ncbi:MAG: choline ABC transporter ATP-binding protein [Neptuniibacter caesariensis]|uniref:Choline ABC transporter ATP-binding protein n=1 Tax=Neptuniibacter caesariensis TaxID=207954 RepID=A0A2G6JPF7_NEPCE|nr:MAG: choline ABC transporter ATP-binding protein [Neptuniibacter caesariensis]
MIEFKNVDVVFGQHPERALPLIDQGISRADILDQTGQTMAVRNASLSVAKGEICVLMGLSGSGKSSLLRTANGLNPITRGEVCLETDSGMQNFLALNESEKRKVRMERITMVFQKFALMPWLTVAQNVAFGLEQKGLHKTEIRDKVLHQLEQVELTPWATKLSSELSGGMQQRVGLARAMAMETDIILMDEPFSALDPLIRNQLQDELLRLQEQTQKTVLFVSHDLDEALKLGNHIAIMKDGEIVQHDTPENIVLNPVDDYVRSFVAHTNPVDVVKANALLKHLNDLPFINNQYQLSNRDNYWLTLADTIKSSIVRYDGKDFTLQSWTPEQKIEELDTRPTLIPADTLLKDIMEIRYHTGHGVLVTEQNKIIGYIGDKNIYHAVLGKLFEDD